MSEEKWICPGCKGENPGTSKYCLTCGAPRFTNLSDLFAKKEPEEKLDFAELKEKRDPHGRLQAVSYSFWSNGMMMNSHEESEVTLKYVDDKEAELVIRFESGMRDGAKDVYRVSAEILSEIAEITERENMPAWSRLKYVPDPRFQPTDYSSSSHLSLTYGSVDPKNPRGEYFSIDIKAMPKEGSEVISNVIDRMRKAAESVSPLSHEVIHPKNDGMANVLGMMNQYQPVQNNGGTDAPAGKDSGIAFAEDGRWICPSCGGKNSGKFCSVCGSRRPEA